MVRTSTVTLNPNAQIDLPHPWEFDEGFPETIGVLWNRAVLKLSVGATSRKLYQHSNSSAQSIRITSVFNTGKLEIQTTGRVELDGFDPIIREIGKAVLKIPTDGAGSKRIRSIPLPPTEQRRLELLESNYHEPHGTEDEAVHTTPVPVLVRNGPPVTTRGNGVQSDDQFPRMLAGTYTISVKELRRLESLPLSALCPRCQRGSAKLSMGQDTHGRRLTCLCGIEIEIISEGGSVPPDPEETQTGAQRQRRRQPSHGKIRL